MITKRIKSIAFVFTLLVLVTSNLWAQQLPFATLKISDGLEDTVIFSIEQDNQGFLWIATRTGINRYDGNRFWTYGQKQGLPHNLARDLYKSKAGVLWAASERGLAWFDGVKFHTLEDWPNNTSARALSEAADGSLWVATYGAGLVHVQTGKQPKILKQLDYNAGMPSDRIRSVMVDTDGNIWAGLSNKVVRVSQGKMEKIDWHIKKTEIRTFFQDSDGSIWAGTRNGIARYDGKAFERLNITEDLAKQTINIITRDNKGDIWIGTRDFGAYKLNKNHNITHLTINDGLPDNSVNHIFEDDENNLWFGTYGGGISRLSTSKVLNWKSQEGLPNPNIYSIVNDKMGCYWFSTNGNGVSRLCGRNFSHFTIEDGLPNNKVLSAMVDSAGDVWFGTLDGISHFHEGNFKNYNDEEGVSRAVSYQIIQANDGTYWIATNNGLNHFVDGNFTQYSKKDGLPDNRINRIFENPDGSLWLATAHGLSKYQNGSFNNWTIKEGLPANFINDIYADNKGGVWIASNNGLSYFHQGKFSNWFVEDGLPHNNCTVILPGKGEDIWIGTSRGVAIFDGNDFTVITSREGLVYDLINRGAGYRDTEGNLWFGTGEGVSRFAADFKPGSASSPPIHIISVFNNHIRLDLNKKSEIKLKDSSMKFDFSGISFQRSPDVNYRYRLNKGDDSPWRETRLNSLQIDSLAAGSYTFEVTARIGQGRWNSQPATYAFIIKPPFWQTYWFMALMLASLIAVFWLRNYRINQYAITLEKKVRERTKQLEDLNKGLEWLANHDNLTRLANRNNVREVLDKIPKDSNLKLGMLLIDLDFFKSINDTYGHAAGDIALKEFAQMLKNTVKDKQIAARWGGEEFLLTCIDCNTEKICQLAQQILENCRSLEIKQANEPSFTLRCSVGFAMSKVNDFDWKKTIQLADIALYSAKNSGRNRAIGYLWNENRAESSWNFTKVLSDKQRAIEKHIITETTIL